MRLLDLFCGAGGAAMGYDRAGFEVVGVDIKPQPHYPFEFHQADALEYPLDGFDVIHASPPCQAYSIATARLGTQERHPDMVATTRSLLEGHTYVIENVPGAPLVEPMMLCGSAFGLRVRRHRLFESNVFLMSAGGCVHGWWDWRYGPMETRSGTRTATRVVTQGWIKKSHGATLQEHQEASGIDWMTPAEMSQAIPPAYTEFIGAQLLEHLKVTA